MIGSKLGGLKPIVNEANPFLEEQDQSLSLIHVQPTPTMFSFNKYYVPNSHNASDIKQLGFES